MFLESDFDFCSCEVAGPWGHIVSEDIPHLNQLETTDTFIILNLVVCRGVIHDCCVEQLGSTG